MRRDFGLQEEGSDSENEPTSPSPPAPSPEAPSPPLESLREATPLPSSPGSPTLNLTPVPFPQPQPPALLRAPTLDLNPSSPPVLPLRDALPEKSRRQEEENSEKVFSDVESDIGDIGEEEKWKEEGSSDVEEEERSVPKEGSLEESIEALEEIASGIINWSSKLPVVDECSLRKEGEEDLKYSPSRRRDRNAALEELALKMLAWKKPDEPPKQRKYAEGYDSLERERHVAMKYHGLDVQYESEW